MTQIKDKNVLITGGASGIGKIMGRICLEKGAKNLIIWDVNPISLEQTKKELDKVGNVTTYSIDITNDQAVVETYKQVLEQFERIGVLINCAGIVRGNKTFNHNSIDDVRLTMNVNSIAPMVLSLQALQPMLDCNEGHICNIASEAGMISNPKMTIYAASKWAVIGWSDSLRIELDEAKSNVHPTTSIRACLTAWSRLYFQYWTPKRQLERLFGLSKGIRISAASHGGSILFGLCKAYCPQSYSIFCLAPYLVYSKRWITSPGVNR